MGVYYRLIPGRLLGQPICHDELVWRLRPGRCSKQGFLGPDEDLEALIAEDAQTLKDLGVTREQVAVELRRVLVSAQAQELRLLHAAGQRAMFINDLKILGLPFEQIDDTAVCALAEARGRPFDLNLCKQKEEEYHRRTDYDWPDLYHPESVPQFSLDYLPDPDLGYMVGPRLQVFTRGYRGGQECPWGCLIRGKKDMATFDFMVLNRQTGCWITGPGLVTHLIEAHGFFEGKDVPYRVSPAKAVAVLGLQRIP